MKFPTVPIRPRSMRDDDDDENDGHDYDEQQHATLHHGRYYDEDQIKYTNSIRTRRASVIYYLMVNGIVMDL